VANAHPDVLAAVSDHAPSNDDDGVALVLEKLFGW
jgi:hydroxymethylpyrimidine pyrophosphatase-like HAD family hydrolase